MPLTMRRLIALKLSFLVTLFFVNETVVAQTVWSGYTFPFSKPSFSDYLLPENQDRITDSVWLTRGSLQGLVNAVSECDEFDCSYAHTFSPEGTEWATDLIAENGGEEIEAANWEQLTFSDWETAYGFHVGGTILDYVAVLHLIEDDIYIDIRFTDWGISPGSGTPFTYERGEPPLVPTGDYNNDGLVDAADYVMWRKTLTQPADPDGSGADGDGDGTIDEDDYDFWAERFAEVVPGGGGSTAVPEPAAGALAVFGMFLLSMSKYIARPSWPGVGEYRLPCGTKEYATFRPRIGRLY